MFDPDFSGSKININIFRFIFTVYCTILVYTNILRYFPVTYSDSCLSLISLLSPRQEKVFFYLG